jgi:hypothetical protein
MGLMKYIICNSEKKTKPKKSITGNIGNIGNMDGDEIHFCAFMTTTVAKIFMWLIRN